MAMDDLNILAGEKILLEYFEFALSQGPCRRIPEKIWTVSMED